MGRHQLHRTPKYLAQVTDQSIIDRFMAKVQVLETGCWQWTAHTSAKGYGQFWMNGRAHWAHRVAAALRGEVPEGFVPDHKCQNPSCVNPEHLELTTPTVNSERVWLRRRIAMPTCPSSVRPVNYGPPGDPHACHPSP